MKKDLYIESEYEKPFHKPFEVKEHFYLFRIVRNYLTHQGMTLQKNEFTDQSKENYSLEQMQEETYFWLRMVKAAIIYLVGVVMIEEKKREKALEDLLKSDKSKNETVTDENFKASENE